MPTDFLAPGPEDEEVITFSGDAPRN
jgi:hypothetical protein